MKETSLSMRLSKEDNLIENEAKKEYKSSWIRSKILICHDPKVRQTN